MLENTNATFGGGMGSQAQINAAYDSACEVFGGKQAFSQFVKKLSSGEPQFAQGDQLKAFRAFGNFTDEAKLDAMMPVYQGDMTQNRQFLQGTALPVLQQQVSRGSELHKAAQDEDMRIKQKFAKKKLRGKSWKMSIYHILATIVIWAIVGVGSVLAWEYYAYWRTPQDVYAKVTTENLVEDRERIIAENKRLLLDNERLEKALANKQALATVRQSIPDIENALPAARKLERAAQQAREINQAAKNVQAILKAAKYLEAIKRAQGSAALVNAAAGNASEVNASAQNAKNIINAVKSIDRLKDSVTDAKHVIKASQHVDRVNEAAKVALQVLKAKESADVINKAASSDTEDKLRSLDTKARRILEASRVKLPEK